jgi:hypothetical protein
MHPDATENFIAPLLDMNVYPLNGSYGFVDRAFLGHARSNLYVCPFAFAPPGQIGVFPATYSEYLIQHTPDPDSMHKVLSSKTVLSSDRISSVFGLVKPLVSHGTILYSSRNDIASPIVYSKHNMNFFTHDFATVDEDGVTVVKLYATEYRSETVPILPNVVYKTTSFPENIIRCIDGVFDRDRYLFPYMHAYALNTSAVTEIFETADINPYLVSAQTTALWACKPQVNGPFYPSDSSNEFMLADVYKYINTEEFSIYPFELVHEMKIKLINNLKNGPI